MYDLLLKDRPEERATLTVLPAAAPGLRKMARIAANPQLANHFC
jgi:hypothetical protein